MNKYHAKKTWSNLCNMMFDSKGECKRGEELVLLERGAVISNLEYQVKFLLCKKPRITVSIDFKYTENGVVIYEDHKGILTRDSRTKYAWLKEQTGINIILHRQ